MGYHPIKKLAIMAQFLASITAITILSMLRILSEKYVYKNKWGNVETVLSLQSSLITNRIKFIYKTFQFPNITVTLPNTAGNLTNLGKFL